MLGWLLFGAHARFSWHALRCAALVAAGGPPSLELRSPRTDYKVVGIVVVGRTHGSALYLPPVISVKRCVLVALLGLCEAGFESGRDGRWLRRSGSSLGFDRLVRVVSDISEAHTCCLEKMCRKLKFQKGGWLAST